MNVSRIESEIDLSERNRVVVLEEHYVVVDFVLHCSYMR